MARSAKGRKVGRKKKKPAQKLYTLERRWEKNKKRKAKRRSRILANAAAARERRRNVGKGDS